MGSDLHFNPPPPDDLPTQVRHLIESREQLLEENRSLRKWVDEANRKIAALAETIRIVREGL